jgi:hypothetical protein
MKFCKKCSTDREDSEFYFDITKQKLYSYCKPCHLSMTSDWAKRNKAVIAEASRKRYRKNPERHKEQSREWRQSHRDTFLKKNRYQWYKRWHLCIDKLGGACVCCGVTSRTMLEIDHIGGSGNIHRKAAGGSVGTYNEIIALGFPRDKFQVMCANCNKSKMRNAGICEHKTGPVSKDGTLLTREQEVRQLNLATPPESRFDRFKRRFDQHLAETIGAA